MCLLFLHVASHHQIFLKDQMRIPSDQNLKKNYFILIAFIANSMYKEVRLFNLSVVVFTVIFQFGCDKKTKEIQICLNFHPILSLLFYF